MGTEIRTPSAFAGLIFLVIFSIGAGIAYATFRVTGSFESVWIAGVALAIAAILSLSIKVADQWEKVVVLRFGKFHELKGPGLFCIIPVIDATPYWIDTRVITGSFKAEKTLTKDTVPVDDKLTQIERHLDPTGLPMTPNPPARPGSENSHDRWVETV